MPLIKIAHADNIGRQQVRRTLDTLEARTKRTGQRLRHDGFAHPRHILDQDMSIAQQSHQQEVDYVEFSNNHPRDVVTNGLCQRFDAAHCNQNRFISHDFVSRDSHNALMLGIYHFRKSKV